MVSSAFVSLTPVLARPQVRVARTTARAPQMSLRRAGARLAAVPATLAATLPAIATEGTGEAFGVDSPLLLIPFVLIPTVFFILFAQFGRQQDNSDFLGGFDDRRN